jgi:hypothetical protein
LRVHTSRQLATSATATATAISFFTAARTQLPLSPCLNPAFFIHASHQLVSRPPRTLNPPTHQPTTPPTPTNMAERTPSIPLSEGVDISPISTSDRRNSLEKHLQTRPEEQDLKNRHILLDTNTAPSLQAKQLELERQRATDNLKKGLGKRPERGELVEREFVWFLFSFSFSCCLLLGWWVCDVVVLSFSMRRICSFVAVETVGDFRVLPSFRLISWSTLSRHLALHSVYDGMSARQDARSILH